MYLCLHKLISKYGKRIVLIFYIYLCIKVEESQSHQIFAFILSPFSFVRNATNFFIHSLSRFISKKKKKLLLCYWFSSVWGPFYSLYMQICLLNTCKLDWEKNLFNFYVESIAFRIKILINITSFAHAIYHTSKRFCTSISPERACRWSIRTHPE